MWQSLVQKLLDSGLTQAAIGEKTGLSQPSISSMANGNYKSGPRGECALRLLALDAARRKKQRSRRRS